MRTLEVEKSLLLLVDFQSRLVPAIDQGAAVVENARRLVVAARLLDVPMIFTEQNAEKLGATVAELVVKPEPVVHKMSFDALDAPEFPCGLLDGRAVIVTGCEAHVCVLQTTLGLLERGAKVFVVADAVGSRRPDSKEAAIRRMERRGVEIVTTEMALFEWLQTAAHPHFREISKLIR
jgi:nicotinamidase-related amidase